jgi:hypothetical protein
MSTFETLRLFAVIVAIFAVPAAICWYLMDRKIKRMEESFWQNVTDLQLDINFLAQQLRNIK